MGTLKDLSLSHVLFKEETWISPSFHTSRSVLKEAIDYMKHELRLTNVVCVLRAGNSDVNRVAQHPNVSLQVDEHENFNFDKYVMRP